MRRACDHKAVNPVRREVMEAVSRLALAAVVVSAWASPLNVAGAVLSKKSMIGRTVSVNYALPTPNVFGHPFQQPGFADTEEAPADLLDRTPVVALKAVLAEKNDSINEI